jgi:hypothetical protein
VLILSSFASQLILSIACQITTVILVDMTDEVKKSFPLAHAFQWNPPGTVAICGCGATMTLKGIIAPGNTNCALWLQPNQNGLAAYATTSRSGIAHADG